MLKEIETVKNRLIDGDFTCVLFINGLEFVSKERGVKPLINFLKSSNSFVGAIAGDKTVGAGAAYLYALLGVKSVWANVVSKRAESVLKQYGIDLYYGELVPYIINRKGDGVCPIEQSVSDAKSPEHAYELILEKLKQLNG